mgnify:CR=1 FL=1
MKHGAVTTLGSGFAEYIRFRDVILTNIGAKNVFIIKFWKEISNIISFLANICVLVITVYTLYLTAFCRKLRFITIGFSMTQFFGESMSISIANKSLHAISITEIFIMKKKTDNSIVLL